MGFWEETVKELKKTWTLFLFFGIFFLIASAFINAGVDIWMNNNAQGDPCRVDFPVDEFTFTGLNEHFRIKYLLINLRDKDLQIEGIDAYCYWNTEDELKEIEEIKKSVTSPPSIEQISVPRELYKINASSSESRDSNCKSPEEEGLYKIRIIARTTEGSCEGIILMEVEE
ncbi:hypothetical protein KAI32_01010 [Candidatus Pacearchaeota archaeon]|nr:hypothetical protein [Candidatus Pacearchaeota archaeon]